MSFIDSKPEERLLIDTHMPITLREAEFWEPKTETIANEINALCTEMFGKIDMPLDNDYSIQLIGESTEPEFQFEIVTNLDDIDQERPPVFNTRLSLVLEKTTNPELNDQFAIECKQGDVRVTVIAPPKEVSIGGTTFVVRHLRDWRLWDYHRTKKLQGYSEEDYPGCRWEPKYNEMLTIIEGEYAGQDLFWLIQEFNSAVYELQFPEEDFSDFRVRTGKKHEANQKAIYRKTKSEIFEASGITFHASAGETSLEELSSLLATVGAFLKRS